MKGQWFFFLLPVFTRDEPRTYSTFYRLDLLDGEILLDANNTTISREWRHFSRCCKDWMWNYRFKWYSISCIAMFLICKKVLVHSKGISADNWNLTQSLNNIWFGRFPTKDLVMWACGVPRLLFLLKERLLTHLSSLVQMCSREHWRFGVRESVEKVPLYCMRGNSMYPLDFSKKSAMILYKCLH